MLPYYLFFRDSSGGNDYSDEGGTAPQTLTDIQPEFVDKSNETRELVSATGSSLMDILSRTRAAMGLNEVRSLLLHGVYEEDGRVFDMKLAARMPTSVRKYLRDDTLEIMCSFDGTAATVQVQKAEQGVVRQPLTEAVAQYAIILEGAFFSLAIKDPELDTVKYSRGADQVYEGRACWTIESKQPGQPAIYHLIDMETALEHVRYITAVIDGKDFRLSVHYTDFEVVNGVNFPRAYVLKVNDIIRGQARVRRVQRNVGLMPWMF